MAIFHGVVQQKADAGENYTGVHAIGLHVLDVFLGNVASRPYVLVTVSKTQLLLVLKSDSRHRAQPHAHNPTVPKHPPVVVIQTDDGRGLVPEFGLDPGCPQVRRLEDVAV